MFFLLPLLFSFSFNVTVRVILSRSKWGSVTFVLGSLQWLPVSFRVNHYYAPQDLQWFGPTSSPTLLWTHLLLFFPLLKSSSHIGFFFFEHTRHLPTLGALHLLEYSSLLSVESYSKVALSERTFLAILCNPLPWFIIFP